MRMILYNSGSTNYLATSQIKKNWNKSWSSQAIGASKSSHHFLLIFPQAGKKTSSDTIVISQIRDDHKIYEITNINQFYIDL